MAPYGVVGYNEGLNPLLILILISAIKGPWPFVGNVDKGPGRVSSLALFGSDLTHLQSRMSAD